MTRQPGHAPRRRQARRNKSTRAAARFAGRVSPTARPPRSAAAFAQDLRDHDGGKGSRGVRAYQLLRSAISTGRLKPGARVLESELADMLGMSRTPIREAMTALEADGLISIDGTGNRIVTRLDYQDVMELYAVREVLEAAAAGLAARNASDMEIVALRDMLEREGELLDDPDTLASHNRRFHEAICFCSHNRYIAKMLQHIQTGMLLLGPVIRTGSERRKTAWVEHRAIVDAIEARDPIAAEAAIRDHVRKSQKARIRLLLQNR